MKEREAFELIDDLQRENIPLLVDSKTGKLNLQGRQKLKYMIEDFINNKSNKIQGIQNEVEEVKGVMKNNIKKMYDNVEDVENMEKKAIELKKGAQDYNNSATKLKRATWWHNCKEYRYDGPETKKPETRLFAPITAEDDAALAQIVRHNLETHDLALPGTAYYDEQLDHLSGYYLSDPAKRFYLVLRDGAGRTLGGVGVAELPFFERCGELQKLYLADEAKGAGLGYELIARIEHKARELGYRRIYLETHSNLRAAIHVYEKSGYRLIPRPKEAVHGTMDRFYIKKL